MHGTLEHCVEHVKFMEHYTWYGICDCELYHSMEHVTYIWNGRNMYGTCELCGNST